MLIARQPEERTMLIVPRELQEMQIFLLANKIIDILMAFILCT